MQKSAAGVLPGGTFDLNLLGQGLVFAQSLPGLSALLGTVDGAAAVVQAPPGTGKTTLVPPLVANALNAGAARRIIVTQPRRVAVRSAARRLATLDGSALGTKVGYTLTSPSRSAMRWACSRIVSNRSALNAEWVSMIGWR